MFLGRKKIWNTLKTHPLISKHNKKQALHQVWEANILDVKVNFVFLNPGF